MIIFTIIPIVILIFLVIILILIKIIVSVVAIVYIIIPTVSHSSSFPSFLFSSRLLGFLFFHRIFCQFPKTICDNSSLALIISCFVCMCFEAVSSVLLALAFEIPLCKHSPGPEKRLTWSSFFFILTQIVFQFTLRALVVSLFVFLDKFYFPGL